MKILFIQSYIAKTGKGDTRTVAAGTVLNLSPDKADRLVTAGVAVDLDTIVAAWRGFVGAADSAFRLLPKTADAWNQHLNHVHAAEALFTQGQIAEARARLENALVALRGVPLVQPDLAV